MAMMMAGRVLLVCALCVLWCGVGGRCDEVADSGVAAGKGNGGSSAVEPAGNSEPVPDASDLRIDVLNVNQATGTSTGKSLEGKKVNTDQQDVLSREDKKDGGPSENLEEPVEDAPGNEKTNLKLKKEEQEGIQPLQSQSNVSPHPQPIPQQSQSQRQPQPQREREDEETKRQLQPPSAPQPHISASEKGEGVGENNTGGEGQSPLGVQDIGNEDPKAPRKGDLLEGPGTKSESSEQVQTTVPNTVTPEHKTQNEMLTPEQKTNESQSTDTSTNIPELQKENKEYPASTEATAQSTSTGSQEQEAEPSTSEEFSPFEEEQSTGTKTTEDAQTPDAAATEKRQTGDNVKVGDSDSSTAVSHTTSPLLLLLLVACAAAAAVVAA
ncbi:Mucin-associated surface protein (MASP) [Trypanosoma cruzi]|uniref:Mucin-associated surface protein (MASP), putative n=2 Tax=Trypanosoma cruzi TaxID=5693 RepID=Q4D494_TRYCC|nr:mucin-associated surface protein (MASP), putative [Trypanosoma cruzi]EAN87348.1 mucin-associated surface protein (MASP), putative [Trypanosoma cruzi]PWV10651.1 Mucin-associated surface protein (MASP) [Trypanosoma cruzi]|eukprot:XP_809199.1 mucin-associated surface protein (MASP) [Trypanosoma cruzi strain CL Brener]